MAGVVMHDGPALSIGMFADAWRLICAPAAGRRLESAAGIEYIFSGLPIPFFNVALLTGGGVSAAALAERGRNACGWAAGAEVPWLFLVTHEALEPGADAAAVLEPCGLVPVLPLTGMLARRVTPDPEIPDGLHIDAPHDAEGCEAIVDVNAAAYAADLDSSKPIFGNPRFWSDHVPALGRSGSEPVAAAAVFRIGGYRYVALVATMPAHQRRGYAEAVMRHALAASMRRHGDLPTVLHATDAGRPIYARMGYQTIATHTAFIERKFVAGH